MEEEPEEEVEWGWMKMGEEERVEELGCTTMPRATEGEDERGIRTGEGVEVEEEEEEEARQGKKEQTKVEEEVVVEGAGGGSWLRNLRRCRRREKM